MKTEDIAREIVNNWDTPVMGSRDFLRSLITAALDKERAKCDVMREALKQSCWCGSLPIGSICDACAALEEVDNPHKEGRE
jgi:hypothetical protein